MGTDWIAERQTRANKMFCAIITMHCKEWCQVNSMEYSSEALILFMVRHNILRQHMINRYVVINRYPEVLALEGGKDRAINCLSNEVPLEPNGIYSIIQNHYAYFRQNKIKFP